MCLVECGHFTTDHVLIADRAGAAACTSGALLEPLDSTTIVG